MEWVIPKCRVRDRLRLWKIPRVERTPSRPRERDRWVLRVRGGVAVGLDFKRALQLGTMWGIVILGALIWRQSAENTFVQACVFGLIALGVAGVGLSEFRGGGG